MEFLLLKVKGDDHEGMNFRGVTVDIVNVRSPWIMFFVFFGCNIKLLCLWIYYFQSFCSFFGE